MKNMEELLKSLTLEEKASLCSGGSYWYTKDIQEKDIPAIMLTDGPHGLRKQDMSTDMLGINQSVPATCFPSAAMTCNSWDEDLIYRIGVALGEECQTENVHVLLGPGVNIKRSPLCGRNFEYFSEDPYLSSNMAKAHINGVQSQGVGTSIKHFAVNNQETRRFGVDAIVDERTLREIYLASFETAIKEAKPWTVMAAYNKVNGEHCCENSHLLKEILRDEWGYEGVVVSDWSATNDQVKGMKESFDLRMPYSGESFNEILVEAVKSGSLSEEDLNDTVRRILTLVRKGIDNHKAGSTYDKELHHALACEAAAESAVLLKNNNSVLPLADKESIALIGGFAKNVRYQGGGSSHINPTKLTDLVSFFAEGKPNVNVSFARGYRLKKDVVDEAFVKEAMELVQKSDKTVLCIGLPHGWESEGYDRNTMTVPNNQIDLLERIAKTGKPVIVLLYAGAPIEMPWIDNVDALFAMYTGGQAICEATVKLLYGDANPCGKLSETYPLKKEHAPGSLNFPQREKAIYEEGIFVGYRYYEKKKLEVLFPFGYGMSYTSWNYSNLKVDKETMKDTDVLIVSLDITNTGSVVGKEIVELYVSDVECSVSKAVKELKGFNKVSCAPGETKTVVFTLTKRSFAYYNVDIHDWYVESGAYQILIGASSDDIRLQKEVAVESTTIIPKKYTTDNTVAEISAHPVGGQIIGQMLGAMAGGSTQKTQEEIEAELNDEENNIDAGIDIQAMFMDIPFGKLPAVTNGSMSEEMIMGILNMVNN